MTEVDAVAILAAWRAADGLQATAGGQPFSSLASPSDAVVVNVDEPVSRATVLPSDAKARGAASGREQERGGGRARRAGTRSGSGRSGGPGFFGGAVVVAVIVDGRARSRSRRRWGGRS